MNNALRNCKKNYIKNLLKKYKDKNEPKPYSEVLHKLTDRGKNKNVSINIISDETGNLCNKNQTDLLNDHFVSFGSTLIDEEESRALDLISEEAQELIDILVFYNLIKPLNLDVGLIKNLHSIFGTNGSLLILRHQIEKLSNDDLYTTICDTTLCEVNCDNRVENISSECEYTLLHVQNNGNVNENDVIFSGLYINDISSSSHKDNLIGLFNNLFSSKYVIP